MSKPHQFSNPINNPNFRKPSRRLSGEDLESLHCLGYEYNECQIAAEELQAIYARRDALHAFVLAVASSAPGFGGWCEQMEDFREYARALVEPEGYIWLKDERMETGTGAAE